MTSFDDARKALRGAVLRVFPDATKWPGWQGVDAWAAPRPEHAVVHASTGTYDPAVTVIGIADRKAGPVVYFLDPGDYFALETHRSLLEGAGLKVGRGCIYHTRKGPLPVEALEELFRRVKARDAAASQGAGKGTRTGAKPAKRDAKKPARAKAPAKAGARKATKTAARKTAKKPAKKA